MIISELITKLEELKEEHGDLYVEKYVPNCCYGDYQDSPEPYVHGAGVLL